MASFSLELSSDYNVSQKVEKYQFTFETWQNLPTTCSSVSRCDQNGLQVYWVKDLFTPGDRALAQQESASSFHPGMPHKCHHSPVFVNAEHWCFRSQSSFSLSSLGPSSNVTKPFFDPSGTILSPSHWFPSWHTYASMTAILGF